MKVFRVNGTFRMGRNWQDFTKEILSESEEAAEEKILSIIGSKHRVKRTNVNIEDINEIAEDEVEDQYVLDVLETED